MVVQKRFSVMRGIVVVAVVMACSLTQTALAVASDKLEVFSWWTSGGEAAALDALFNAYKIANPEIEIVNATVAGGGGSRGARRASNSSKESKAIGESSRAKGFPMTNFGDLRYNAWGAGVPIVYEGQVVGAIGVSSLPEEEDMQLARMGAGLI